MRGGWAIGAAILGTVIITGTATAAPARAPNLALCAMPESPEGGERTRKRPLPVPQALRGTVKSDLYHFAIATLDGGGTVCVDTSWIETADDVMLTPDGRYFGFGWMGYETSGHVMVDRSGEGSVVQTATAPVFSPSRRFFAADRQQETDTYSMTGLGVWEVLPAGTAEIGRVGEVAGMYDLRIVGWAGESCIELTGIERNVTPEIIDQQPRVRFRAGPGKDGWSVARGACPSA